MPEEHELIVLRRDLPDRGLKAGDVGVIVAEYDTDACEVEFVNAGGTTLAVLTLGSSDLRPMENGEILHVRSVEAV